MKKNDHLLLKLLMLSMCIILSTYDAINAQCIAPVIYPKMGVNLDGISNYGSARIFTDFAKESNLREGQNNPGNYWGSYSGGFNASGWPSNAFTLSIVESNNLAADFTGTYRVRYQGPTSALNGSVDVGGGYSEKTITVNNGGNQWIDFNSGVSNLQIIPIVLNGTPTNYTFSNFPTFSPQVTNTYSNFNLYRMMDWGHTNTNTVSTWANRTPKNGVQAKSTGVAYEYMIEICNATGKDLWINIPVMADDNFITQLATMIKNNLRPDKNVWVEYGNEIWNFGGGFWGYRMNNVMTANRGNSSSYWNNLLRNGPNGYDGGSYGTYCVSFGSPDQCGYSAYQAAIRFQALRTKEISEIFASVWGASEINNRVRVLLAGQIGYAGKGHGYNIAEGLAWLNGNGWTPKNYIYAISGAPYFGMNGANINDANSILNNMNTGIDNMFLCHNCNGPDGNQIEGFAGRAREYGLRFIAYEGGPDLDYTTNWNVAKRDAKRSATMRNLCVKYWNYWYQYGDDGQFNLFGGGYSSEYRQLYAWAENVNDNSPTRQAANQIMTTPNPALTAGATIPGILDARKVYGWADCGDMYPCAYGNIVGPMFPGNMYNHAGNSDAWLVSSNANANYTIEVQAEYWTNAQGRMYIDGTYIGNYAVAGPDNSRRWYTLTVGGLTSFPLNWGTHVIRLEYTTGNADLFQLRFTQVAPNPPATPAKPQGRISICNGGENNIAYSVTFDQSVCQYEWSITGSNMQSVGATNLNVLTVNYLNGFAGGTIRVRGIGTGPTYSAWSAPVSVTSVNCGITANNLTPCIGQVVNFTENSGQGSTWEWNFNDATATVTGATTGTPTVRFSTAGLKTIVLIINKNAANQYTFYKYNYINVGAGAAGSSPVFLGGLQNTRCQGAGAVTYGATVTGTVPGYTLSPASAGTINGSTGQVTWSGSFSGIATVVASVAGSSCGGGPLSTSFVITVNPSISSPAFIIGSGSQRCQGAGSTTYTATTSSGVIRYVLTGGGASSINSSTGQVTWDAAFNGTATVTASITGCGGPLTATHVITVSSPVNLVRSGSTSICTGGVSSTTFTGAISYVWQPGNLSGSVNNLSPTGSTTYTVTGTSGACTSTSTFLLTVNTTVASSITASASQNGICSGTQVTFTGVPTNGGAGPIYQWKVNGSNVGTNSATYVYTPLNNDQVSVQLSSNAVCASPVTSTSAIVVMSVSGTVVPSITASANQNGVCSGTLITFSSTATGTGGTPTYQWKVNGSNVGSNSSVYTTTGLANGDVVRVVLTSSSACASPSTATSSGITMNITGTVSPTATISSSAASICSGSGVSFTASGTNLGLNPIYTFTRNGSNVQSGLSNVYSSTGLSNGDNIRVVVSASGSCLSPSTATSSGINMTVNAPPTLSTSGNLTICSGTGTSLTVSGASTYSWQPGNLTGNINTLSPVVTSIYTITGTSAGGCVGTSTVAVNVNSLPAVGVAGSTAICSGGTGSLTASGSNTYNWQPGNLNGAVQTVSPLTTTEYTVTGTSAQGCVSMSKYTLTVNSTISIAINGPTSQCVGGSSVLTASGASTYSWSGPFVSPLNQAVVTASPLVTSTYTVTGSSGAGCTATGTYTLTVNSNPTVNVNGTSSICTGSTATLTASGASTYNWQPGNLSGTIQTLSPSSTTTYTVTGTTAQGCVNTRTYTVTVNSSPSVNISGVSSICNGSSTSLTASGASSYNWQPGNLSGSAQTVSPTSTTTYTVTGTTAQGCSAVQLQTVTVLSTPSQASSPTGSVEVCQGQSTSSYSGTVPANAASLTYLMSLTSGSGYGSTSINVSTGVVSWDNAFTGMVSISVAGVSGIGCGTGAYSSGLTVTRRAAIMSSAVSVGGCNLGKAQVAIQLSGGLNTSYQVSGTSISGAATVGSPFTYTSGLLDDGSVPTYVISDGSTCSTYTVTGTAINCACPSPGYSTENMLPSAVCAGVNSTTLSITGITGNPNVLQWQISTTGGTSWSNYSSGTDNINITNASYSLNGSRYRLVMINACGSSTTTTGQALIVRPQVGAATISGMTDVCQGVSSSEQYTGGAANADSYSWSLFPSSAGVIDNTGLVTWNSGFSGTATVSVLGVSSYGCSSGSGATLTVNRNSALVATGMLTSTCNASLQATVSFNISGGAAGGYTVSGYSGGPGITSGSFTSPLLSNGTHHFIINNNSVCTPYTVTSTINCNCPQPQAGQLPTSPASVCAGTNSSTISIGNVTDAYGPLTYRWIENGTTTLSNTGTYSIATNGASGGGSVLTINNADETMNGHSYKVVVSNQCGNSITTTGVTLAVDALPTVTLGTVTTLCQGAISYGLPVSNLQNGTDSYSITSTLVGFVSQSGTLNAGTLNVLLPSNTPAGTYRFDFRSIKNSSGCSSLQSYTITISPIPGITFGTLPDICYGGTTMSIPYSGTSGGTSSYTIAAGTNAMAGFTTQSSQPLTASSLVIAIPSPVAPQSYDFNITVNNGACSSTTPLNVIANVNPAVATPVFSNAVTTSRCQGTGADSYVATALNSTLVGYGIEPVSGGNSINSSTGQVTWSPSYVGVVTITATASGRCGAAQIAAKAVTVTGMPLSSPVVGGVSSLCQGNEVQITLTGSESDVDYQVYESNTAKGSVVRGNGSQITLNAGSYSAQSQSYTFQIRGTRNGCGPVTMNTTQSVQIDATPNTGISVSAVSSELCVGTKAAQVKLNTSEASVIYKLYEGTTQIGTENDNSGGSLTLSGTSLPIGTHSLQVKGVNGSCPEQSIGAPVSIVVKAQPTKPLVSYPQTRYCSSAGNPVAELSNLVSGGVFSATATNGSVSIDPSQGIIDLSSGNVRGTISVTYTLPQDEAKGCLVQTSDVFVITIDQAPAAAEIIYPNVEYCNSGSATPSVVKPSGGVFSAIEGVKINASTGVINLDESSTGGPYNIVYSVAGTGACSTIQAVTTVTIRGAVGGVASTTVSGEGLCEGSTGMMFLNGYSGTIRWQQRKVGSGNAGWGNVIGGDSLSGGKVRVTDALSETLEYRALVSYNGCTRQVYSNVLTINVSPKSLGGRAVVDHQEICNGKGTVITLTGAVGSIQWEQSSDSSNYRAIDKNEEPTAVMAQYVVKGSTDYNTTRHYKAIVKSGVCPAVEGPTVRIRVCDRENFPPNALSPHTDGENSVWNVSKLRLLDQAEVRIYNRYGVEVHYATGQQMNSNPWDGGGLPAGTYYYLIDTKDGGKVKSGAITIVK